MSFCRSVLRLLCVFLWWLCDAVPHSEWSIQSQQCQTRNTLAFLKYHRAKSNPSNWSSEFGWVSHWFLTKSHSTNHPSILEVDGPGPIRRTYMDSFFLSFFALRNAFLSAFSHLKVWSLKLCLWTLTRTLSWWAPGKLTSFSAILQPTPAWLWNLKFRQWHPWSTSGKDLLWASLLVSLGGKSWAL